MSYPIKYPTPQSANVQVFQAPKKTSTPNHMNNTSWIKPQGASFVWFTLIGAGGGGGGYDGVDFGGGGGTGAVTNFMCPAFLIPDQLSIVVGNGGAGGSTSAQGAVGGESSVYYDVKAKEAYMLLNAYGGQGGLPGASGGAGGNSMLPNNFTAMGILERTSGVSGNTGASGTTFLTGGQSGTANYLYSNAPVSNSAPGFFMMQPIMVSAGGYGNGGSASRDGGIGSGGGGGTSDFGGKGGDGLVVIITW